jgi:protein gp37
MGDMTGIEWAEATWNPWMGCHKVSPACAHCYMFREMRRYGRDPNVVVRAKDATFYAPLKWREPRRIFTCSWSDFFIEEADQWRRDAWAVIGATCRHTYQMLTKRPERIEETMPLVWLAGMPAHIWMGVSLENARFYWRIEDLLGIPAAVRFLSIEPLLGPMPELPLDGIHWVIVGGESGPGFRPLNLDWVRQIRDRCVDRGVAFFFKQHAGLHPKRLGRLLDGREWNELPKAAGA